MSKDFFNELEFTKAVAIASNNPLEAKKRYEEYLEKYPNDYISYTYYIHTLITLGELNEAIKYIKHVEKIVENDTDYYSKTRKINFFKEKILFANIRILSFQEKYDELYNFYLENIDKLNTYDFNSLIFYIKSKVGKVDSVRENYNTYLFKQIVDYSDNDFFEHIKKHLYEYSEDIENPSDSIFVEGFPIEKIINEIKQHISNGTNKLLHGFYENKYIFKYDECGRDKTKMTNFFMVITFCNNANIITLCPSCNCENLPYIDLNYLKINSDSINEHKVKRKSRIDKFNEKYNLKKS